VRPRTSPTRSRQLPRVPAVYTFAVAVDAKQTLAGRTSSRRREMRDRVVLLLAALVMIAGIVVYFQSRADRQLPSATAPTQRQQTTTATTVIPGGKLDPAARGVAVRFIRTALARTDLAQAWALAAPDLRSAVTKKQWLRGELPFPPFPVNSLETTGFNVVGHAPGEVLLEVLLVPKPNSGYVPTRYEVTLVRKGAKAPWRVSYFLPYAPPGMYTEQG
jgi:hypothetical protein